MLNIILSQKPDQVTEVTSSDHRNQPANIDSCSEPPKTHLLQTALPEASANFCIKVSLPGAHFTRKPCTLGLFCLPHLHNREWQFVCSISSGGQGFTLNLLDHPSEKGLLKTYRIRRSGFGVPTPLTPAHGALPTSGIRGEDHETCHGCRSCCDLGASGSTECCGPVRSESGPERTCFACRAARSAGSPSGRVPAGLWPF